MSFANGTPDGFEHTVDLAERTGIPRRTWDTWRHKRTGPPYVKHGHLVLYRTEDVDRWLAERKR